ncbi:MAG TPA: lysophospholipid acyltransferase family protein [Stellaceae bacterium]|jgi:1-acyl-sn-glycerol-3-phosphate acyltransferase|nr:lysophospholipid acyltransferase family protein [Stellaceae bacterium]
MSGFVLRILRITVYLVVTLPAMPVQALFLAIKSPRARHFPSTYHRLICRILGIRLVRRGAISTHRPTLFVCNHTSYLDIEIMGAGIEGSFVSKAEVSHWPIFGWLAKLQRTIFVERADRAGAAQQRDEISRRLDEGDNLILFPEGTSGDGIHLLPFKTTLFAAAMDERVVVQPVSVIFRLLDGIPLGRFYRPFFAWYGDMTMAPHLWKMLGLGRLTVVMTFHEPVRLKDFGSRKLLAEHCARVIADGMGETLAGREATPIDTPRAPALPAQSLAAQ